VFFLAIASRVKKRWVTELFPGSACVTAYGGKNPWEDFAETYAYYALDPQLLQSRLPEKHAFMRDCVFSGDPETLKEWDRLG
jgi:Mlc titration factor MtfA (ptsG expression regulator)